MVDPRPATLLAVRSLHRCGTPLHLLSARKLEPAFYARGVRRWRLPALASSPEIWLARLLELAARLEPRPLLFAFSRPARELLRAHQQTLAPHYELANLAPLDIHAFQAEDFRADAALRRTVLRGEPAFEVQVTLDAGGTCTGACVLTWVAGAAPFVVVTSVEGNEVLERSVAWLREKRYCGYARLIWAPDRFGRIDLQSAGTLPGTGWSLAHDDGVDFPALWYACVAGIRMTAQIARQKLSRRIAIAEPGLQENAVPLVQVFTPWSIRDPLPWFVAFLGGLLRR